MPGKCARYNLRVKNEVILEQVVYRLVSNIINKILVGDLDK